MRDPDTIREMLELVEAAWTANPELRLGQLIFTAAKLRGNHTEVSGIEDSALRKALCRLRDGATYGDGHG